jgi:hypothetical protein
VKGGKIEVEKVGRWEGEIKALRPLEERFRLRSSSYDPTSRFRLEAKENKSADPSFSGGLGGLGRKAHLQLTTPNSQPNQLFNELSNQPDQTEPS